MRKYGLTGNNITLFKEALIKYRAYFKWMIKTFQL